MENGTTAIIIWGKAFCLGMVLPQLSTKKGFFELQLCSLNIFFCLMAKAGGVSHPCGGVTFGSLAPKIAVRGVYSQNIYMLTDPRCLGVLSFKATWSSSQAYSGFWGMLLQAHDWVPNEGSCPFGERLFLAHCWKKCKELSELCAFSGVLLTCLTEGLAHH